MPSDTDPDANGAEDYKIKYLDKFELDWRELPPSTVKALIRRGVNHYFGNEQASKLSTMKAKAEADGTPMSDDDIESERDALFEAAKAHMFAGTIGTSVRGPRGTPIDSIVRRIAEAQVRATLKALGKPMPTGDKVVEFNDGTKLTRAELIQRRIVNPKFAEGIRAEAEAELRRLEAMAKPAEGEAVEAASPEDLDL